MHIINNVKNTTYKLLQIFFPQRGNPLIFKLMNAKTSQSLKGWLSSWRHAFNKQRILIVRRLAGCAQGALIRQPYALRATLAN